MRRTRWIAAFAALSAFAPAAPAGAHDGAFGSAWWMGENHPGWYWESQESQSKNVKMIGSVDRTRRDTRVGSQRGGGAGGLTRQPALRDLTQERV